MTSRKLSLSVAQGSALTLLLLSGGVHAQIDYFEFSGILSQEWAVGLHRQATQKQETVFQPRLDIGWTNGTSVTAIGRLRFDEQSTLSPYPNGTTAQAEIRELYLDTQWGESFWRIGKQQVVWGQADGLRVLDAINPLDYREFILGSFEERRIPLWMVNAEFPVSDNWTAQLLWVPDTSYNEMPPSTSDFSFTSPLLVPTLAGDISDRQLNAIEVTRPDDPIVDSDVGIRLSAFLDGWDVSVNWLWHHLDQAVYYQSYSPGQVTLLPRFERSHLLGGSASNVFGNTILRVEVGYSSDQFFVAQPAISSGDTGIQKSSELSYVVGLDWQPGSQWLLSAQLFQSVMFNHNPATLRDKTESQLTALIQRSLYNESLTLRVLLIHGINRGDSSWQIEASYEYSSTLSLHLGMDIFDGTRQGIFGQFDQNDRVSVAVEWSF